MTSVLEPVRSRAKEPPHLLEVWGSQEPVTLASAWLGRLGRSRDVDRELLFHAELCLAELVGNAVEHGHEQPQRLRIRLQVGFGDRELRLTIRDNGLPFDPFARRQSNAPVDLRDDRVGGWGLDLVRRFATHAEYSYRHGENTVELIFRP